MLWNSILEDLNFQNFLGGMPSDPLFWHALHASVFHTLLKYTWVIKLHSPFSVDLILKVLIQPGHIKKLNCGTGSDFKPFFKIIPKLSESNAFLVPLMLSLETTSEINTVVIEIQGVENGELAVPVNSTLVHYMAFLAADTWPCILCVHMCVICVCMCVC